MSERRDVRTYPLQAASPNQKQIFSSIINEQTHCHTHKNNMQFLCQYTTFSTRVSEVECLFLRSAEIFSRKFQQQMTVLE